MSYLLQLDLFGLTTEKIEKKLTSLSTQSLNKWEVLNVIDEVMIVDVRKYQLFFMTIKSGVNSTYNSNSTV